MAPRTKKDFILAQPSDMPPSDVVARGRAAGLRFSAQLVVTYRWKARGQKPKRMPAGTKRRVLPPESELERFVDEIDS